MVHLVFSESPQVALSILKMVSGSGDTITLTGLRAEPDDPNTLVADVPLSIGPGSWRIVWRIAARDGHPRQGTIDFSIAAPAGASAIQPGVDSVAAPSTALPSMSEDEERNTMAIGGALASIASRWLSFLAIFVLIGVVAFKFGVLDRIGAGPADTFVQIASSSAAALGIGASAGLLLGTSLRLARESADMPDIPLTSMLFASTWGLSILAQLVVSVIAALAFRAAQSGSESSRSNGWRAALVAAVVIAATPALSGHAASSELPIVSILADIIHVGAGSAWLGTLSVIVIVGISAAIKTPDSVRPGSRVASLVNAFSPMALTCGGLMVLTGAIASLFHLKHVRDMWTTPYGVALALKLMFVAMLFGAGAWNWRRMKPRLTGDDAVVPLRSMATFELVLATIVLGITAALVALELP